MFNSISENKLKKSSSPGRRSSIGKKSSNKTPSRSKSGKSRGKSPGIIHRTGAKINADTSTTALEHQNAAIHSIKGAKGKSRMQSAKSKSPNRSLSRKSNKLLKTLDSNYATKCEISVQTDIRGVDHRILIRPDKFDSDPFEKSDMGKIDDNSSLNAS